MKCKNAGIMLFRTLHRKVVEQKNGRAVLERLPGETVK